MDMTTETIVVIGFLFIMGMTYVGIPILAMELDFVTDVIFRRKEGKNGGS